jgi:hypothetical protein
MFIPNSPNPPSGMTVSDCLLLLKKGFSPQPNLESYHTAPHPAPAPPRNPGFSLCSSLNLSSRLEWPAFSSAPATQRRDLGKV